MNKDSFYFKYQFGPWPEFEKIEVEIDTKLPEIKPKEDRLKEPDFEEFKKRMNDINDEINKKKDRIQAINKEKQEKIRVKREQRDEKEKEEAKEAGTKTFKELLKEKNELREKLKVYKVDVTAADKLINDV